MRVAKIDEQSIVVAVKNVLDNYNLGQGEFFSDVAELGQRMLEDGTFVDVPVELTEPQPTIEERILFETEYQTMLLESVAMGGI